GAIGPHDGVHLAGLHVQRQALEDFLAGDAGVEVFDLEHGIGDSDKGFVEWFGGKRGSRIRCRESPISNPESREGCVSRRCLPATLRAASWLPPRTPSAVRGTPACRSRRRSSTPRLLH